MNNPERWEHGKASRISMWEGFVVRYEEPISVRYFPTFKAKVNVRFPSYSSFDNLLKYVKIIVQTLSAHRSSPRSSRELRFEI